jgi:bacterioferritin-associated ferredoxin
MTTTTNIRISASALSDHTARLYVNVGMTGLDENWEHIDMEEATLIVHKWGALTSQVSMSDAAINEFIADMEYQVEAEMDNDMGASSYCNVCKRALASIKLQTGRA